MKKGLTTILAVAAALLAVSCAKEQDGPAEGKAMVSYTIDGPVQVATKAMGIIGSEYTLYYEVRLWDGSALGDALTGEGLSGHKDIAADAWPASVSFDLARGKQYKILFWAQSKTAPEGLYDASNLAAVAIDYSKMAASEEKCDAFYGSDVITPAGATAASATLYRPFALVNLGTSDAAQFKTASGGCTVGDVKVTINGSLANSFNVATGEPGAGVDTSFAPNAAPIDAYDAKTLVVGESSFNYLSAVYVLPAGASDVIEVAYDIKDNATTPADITSLTVSNVPVHANYRTNITGKLLTGTTTYEISVDQAFAGNTNKVVGPTFADVTALNAYFASMADNSDNGDINPEEVTLETIADGDIITLPAIADDVVIRITGTLATGTLNIAYAASGDKPANLSLFVAQLEKLVANIPSTHFTLLSGSHITDQADVHTSASTFVIEQGAKVGTVNIHQGNAEIAGAVANVYVVADATSNGETPDGTNPVQVFLTSESAVEKIHLSSQSDVTVEQPKDQIEVEATEKKVAVYVNNGAANSTATAQNGGVIYVKAEVPCTVTADGTSEAEDGSAVSSTVIIQPSAAGSAVVASNGGSIDLTANGNCSASAEGVAAEDPETSSTITVTEVKDENIVIDANASEGGEIETNPDKPDTQGAVKYFVARIGDVKYESIEEAISVVQNNQTIVMLVNITQDDGILFDKEGVNAAINLDGKTIKVNKGSNVNSRAFRIDNGTLEVYGGSIVAVGEGTNADNGTGCYGAFRVEANGVLNAHDLSLSNARPWGLNVKVIGGAATLDNVSITSSYGGGIEVTEADLGNNSKAGSAILTNCHFTQTGYYDHCSTTLSVSGGSALTINGGSYESDNYSLYVFSSGGEITVNDGTFSGNKDGVAIIAAIDLNSYPNYTGGLKLKGGEFHGGYSITSPAYMEVTGGTFSEDPTPYLAAGYEAIQNTDGTYSVGKLYVAKIGEVKYESFDAALAAAKTALGSSSSVTIDVIHDCDALEQTEFKFYFNKQLIINGENYTITHKKSNGRIFKLYGPITLTLNGGKYVTYDYSTYGFIDMRDNSGSATSNTKLIANGTTFEGGAASAGLICARADNQEIDLEDVIVNCTGGQTMSIVNGYNQSYKLTINGGTYTYHSDNKTAGVFQAGKFYKSSLSDNTTVALNGVTINTTSGPLLEGHGTVTITNCSIQDPNSETQWVWCNSGLAAAIGGKVTVDGGCYKGNNAVFVYNSGGEITINGGTFEGNQRAISIDNNTSQSYWTGPSTINVSGGSFNGSIVLDAQGIATTDKTPSSTLNISGGTFTVASGNLFTITNLTQYCHINITGGTFSQDPTQYVVTGYEAIDNGDGTWTVQAVN